MANDTFLTILCALGFALIYLPFVGAPVGFVRSALKTTPVILLALTAWNGGAPVALIGGLGLSALGDLALSRDGRGAFLYGVAAFILAHFLYILLFLNISGLALSDAFFVAPLAGVVLVGLALSAEIWLIPYTNGLRWAVRAYVAVICTTMLAALTLPSAHLFAGLGVGMFICSDLALALGLFRITAGTNLAGEIAHFVWISYIGAQTLIFWGIVMV